MRNSILVLLLLISTFSWEQEFKVYDNGLIYNEKTMGQLTDIVDSLNLKFKVCELNPKFYSEPQTFGSKIVLDKKDINSAIRDIKENISLTDFKAKYQKAEITNQVLIVQFNYTNYLGEKITEYSEINGTGGGKNIQLEDNTKNEFNGNWVYEKRSDRLYAFYLPKAPSKTQIPEKYALQIGYADCLIDTTTLKFKEDAKSGWYRAPQDWESLTLVEQEALLDTLRSTKVIGGCSMDLSPRYHAKDIALLSAQTTKWEVFLRAHLDIMNDRFDRVSDGSYAWGDRQTYIRELEELNIDVPKLIIGISLRVHNPAQNHYYGNVQRLGRALAETRFQTEIEDAMFEMMHNNKLDAYNRMIIYFLFRNYNYFLKENAPEHVEDNRQKFEKMVLTLPTEFQNQFDTTWK